ncbi:unnamed protein product [Lactuca virosa]|uniref:Uncharacterized protein n=1 Tax=Lactuca virosa TaxID=75947 RepID=A0AAU9M322_9ASTR|nr:unnamed protein product [Lactuca virosa]
MEEIEAIPGVQVELDDSPPVKLYDDDVGLDGGAEGTRDEGVGDGDRDGHGAGDVGAEDEVVGDGDGEGHCAGDVDDGDGPKGDGDGPEDGVDELGDDEGHEVVPMVRRIRKTSERITRIKLRKGVCEKDGGGSSSVNPINLE